MKYITEEPILLDARFALAQNDKAGAVVIFSGDVRNHNEGKKVEALEYESKADLAALMIQEILKEAKLRFGIHYADCVHRVGRVEIGERAILVITAGSHREETYDANRYIVDRVKYDCPIWKKEHFASGDVVWGKNSTKRPKYLDE